LDRLLRLGAGGAGEEREGQEREERQGQTSHRSLLESESAGLAGRRRRWRGSGETLRITKRGPPARAVPRCPRGRSEQRVDEGARLARADETVGEGFLELIESAVAGDELEPGEAGA